MILSWLFLLMVARWVVFCQLKLTFWNTLLQQTPSPSIDWLLICFYFNCNLFILYFTRISFHLWRNVCATDVVVVVVVLVVVECFLYYIITLWYFLGLCMTRHLYFVYIYISPKKMIFLFCRGRTHITIYNSYSLEIY